MDMDNEDRQFVVSFFGAFIAMTIVVAASIILFGPEDNEPETPEIQCEVLRDTGPLLRGVECTKEKDGFVKVRLYLVDRVVRVHESRVRWKETYETQMERELMKPLKREAQGDK